MVLYFKVKTTVDYTEHPPTHSQLSLLVQDKSRRIESGGTIQSKVIGEDNITTQGNESRLEHKRALTKLKVYRASQGTVVSPYHWFLFFNDFTQPSPSGGAHSQSTGQEISYCPTLDAIVNQFSPIHTFTPFSLRPILILFPNLRQSPK